MGCGSGVNAGRKRVCWGEENGLAAVAAAGIYKVRLSLIGFFCIRWFMQGVILGSIALLWAFVWVIVGKRADFGAACCCQKKERPDVWVFAGGLGRWQMMGCIYVPYVLLGGGGAREECHYGQCKYGGILVFGLRFCLLIRLSGSRQHTSSISCGARTLSNTALYSSVGHQIRIAPGLF
jgi:hypothetical protein